MRCSGCGSNISFGGQVCPRCHRDKSSDQAATVFGMIALFGGGWIGSLVGGVGGAIVGGIGSAFIVVLLIALGSNNSTKKAPAVRIEPPLPVATKAGPISSAAVDPATRLRRLDQLKADGLVTDAEYREQRRAIIRAV